MITWRQLIDDGFVEIAIDTIGGPIFGGRFSYSTDSGVTYQPCAIYLTIDSAEMLEVNNELWNAALDDGKVLLDGGERKVYWHLFRNKMDRYEGIVRLRCDLLKEGYTEVQEIDMGLESCKAVFFNAWQERDVWKVNDGNLTLEEDFKGKTVLPYVVKPGLKGDYEVFVAVGWGLHHSMLKVNGEPNRYPFMAPKGRKMFAYKNVKEIPWKAVHLEEDTTITFSLIPLSISYPEKYPFGKIAYLKFVPVKAPVRKIVPKWNEKKLALYFEPYSWSFVFGLQDRWRVREALELFREMGADEIHNQMMRFGCKAMYRSKIAEPFYGMNKGDDEGFSRGPEEMVRALDILQESIDICRELGMKHYTNAGLTICYVGDPLEDRFSREHPEFRTGDMLRYKFPETRAYAGSIVKEFIEWGSEGISIDCMRYPFHNTEEELYLFFDAVCDVINKKLPLTIRIPAGDVKYFRVAEYLAKSGRLQCVIPSDDSQAVKLTVKPYLKLKDYGCKVYGRVDGWNCALWWDKLNGLMSMLSNPKEIKQDIVNFFEEGADGIFVYQADQHLMDAVNRMSLDWRKWSK